MKNQFPTFKQRLPLLVFFCIYAAGYGFADIGAQITNCATAVCDFRGQGAQSAQSTIVLSHAVTLLLDGTQITLYGSPGIQIASSGVHILGVTTTAQLIQGTVGSDIISSFSYLADFEVRGISFVGAAGQTAPTSSNNGIFLSASNFSNSTLLTPMTQIRITGNTFTRFQGHAVYIQNANDVEVSGNVIWLISGGIRFSAVARGKIEKNVVRDTQVPNGGFTVAIGLDSTAAINNISYPPCSEVQILNNTVQNYQYAQAILVHAGARITVAGNMINGVMIGISLNTFNSSDNLNNVTVTGNSFMGIGPFTGQPTDPGTGNYGIFVGGGPPAATPEYIVIANNTVAQANLVIKAPLQGGISLGYANDVIVSNNYIHDTEINGISLNNPNNHIQLLGNSISDLIANGGDTVGIYLGPNSAQSGSIRANIVYGATHGYRFDTSSPSLLFGPNDAFATGTAVVNANNVTVTN